MVYVQYQERTHERKRGENKEERGREIGKRTRGGEKERMTGIEEEKKE